MLELVDLTGQIIGAAIVVHKQLGPGFLESIYEEALCVEFTRQNIPYVKQWSVPVFYEGVQVGSHRIDLMVKDQVIVELKAARHLDEAHFATLRSYLRAAGLKHGLLLNFSNTKVEIKRVIDR